MKFRVFKLHMLFVLISGIGLPALSQQMEISSSKPDYNYGSTRMHKIIGHDSSHYYVIKSRNNQYYFENLDMNLNVMLQQRIKLFEGFRTYELEAAFHFYNDLIIFVSWRRFDNVVLFYQKIDISNLLPSTELKEITTIPFIRGNWPDFHFDLSIHETKLLVACRIEPFLLKSQYNEYFVFGKDLSLIWKRRDNFQFTGQGPRENKYLVDETGNVSVLSLIKRQSIASLFSNEKNAYRIYRYTNFGRIFKEYPITFPNKYIRGIRIIGNDQGGLICAGLYSELFRSGVRGSFFFKIDRDNNGIFDNNMNEFDNALLERFSMIKEPTIAKQELIDYILTDLVLRENGKIIFIAEQFFKQPYDTYNNLLVICFDETGNVYWSQIIEKNQDFNINTIRDPDIDPSDYRDYLIETGAMDQNTEDYSSYALMAPVDRNGIIIFYNDNIGNLEDPGRRKNFNRPRKSFIRAVMIDEFGNVSSGPVLKWKRKALFPEPLRFYDTRYNTIVIPAFKGNKYNYYKITAAF